MICGHFLVVDYFLLRAFASSSFHQARLQEEARLPLQHSSLTSQHTDEDRHVRSFPFAISVQAHRRAQPIAMLTGCEGWAKKGVSIARLGFLQLSGVILNPPDQLAVSNFLQIPEPLLLAFYQVIVQSNLHVALLQGVLLLYHEIIDQLHVVNQLALAVLWLLLTTAL